ncbi:hypothetical protein HYU45_02605 [Candidatus Daviesbacteria bacterium]|nr:hypothetical protein [Candidatus Daviesbacteria bacterium]
MLILGVCNAIDSGACLLKDGKILAAVSEERFVRKKNIATFPKQSIKYILQSQKLKPTDIDWIGCGAWNGVDQLETLPRLIEDVIDQLENSPKDTKDIILQRIKITGERDTAFKKELFEGLEDLGFPREKVILCDHHYSHALTAFYCSPYKEAYIFTADGRGDFRSVSLWSATRIEGLKFIDMATELTSLGAMYGFITKLLGFTPDKHEGKVTGLAARGKQTKAFEILKSGLWFDEEKGKIRSRIGDTYRPFISADWPEIHKKLAGFSRDDIAYAAQKLLEETLMGFLIKHIGSKSKGSINLCLAGGCMSNVKLNYELSNLPQVKSIYIFPQMGDGGNSLGGAINIALTKGNNIRHFGLPTVYLGPAYSNEEIKRVLESQKVSYIQVQSQDKIKKAVQFLIEGKLVGWYQGRMEYGPRALGARSILAEATDKEITQILNQRLERSDFMPFAPVTIPEYADKCFVGWRQDHISSRFMTICYQCTPYLKSKCPAIVHVDGSARPQVVFREQNPEYYEVVKSYIEQTGNPVLINTSFNNHEEPIVNTPTDAINSLIKRNVDVLIAGDLIVSLK